MKPLHIGITSVQFDAKPEGICTGRLIRALLERGHRVTLLTSTKARTDFAHPRLRILAAPSGLRYPRAFFKTLAHLQGNIYSNYYLWSRTVARTDFRGDVPDVFYGRAWPHASLVPAYELASRHRRPLILHFSDPFPSPSEDVAADPRFFADLQTMIDAADALTFTNTEAIAYQRRFVRFDMQRAYVLNHVAPPPRISGAPGTLGHFYYAGGLGTARPVGPLLDGFAVHVEKFPQHRLYFVGTARDYLMPEIRARRLGEKIEVLPFTSDLREIYRRAGALVSIDALIANPVYTPSKLIDYLVTDRPVLCLTPPGSPAAKLALRSPQTILAVTDYAPAAVAAGMADICTRAWDQAAYTRRLEQMRDFSGAEVAAHFERMVEDCCRLQNTRLTRSLAT
jgi:hypothetical protein